jgi:phage terminase small subunit
MGADAIPQLTPQQQTFCEEYAKDKNGVRAALAAGLSETYFAASVTASRLLKTVEIRTAIRRILKIQAKRLKTEVPDVVREWAIIGRADVTDYVTDQDGKVTTAPGVPKAALRAVKKVKQTKTERLKDSELTVVTVTEIDLHDKLSALSKLFEHLHGVLPGEKPSGGGIPIEYAVEFAEFVAARNAARAAAVGASGVPVVPEAGVAESSVPQ